MKSLRFSTVVEAKYYFWREKIFHSIKITLEKTSSALTHMQIESASYSPNKKKTRKGSKKDSFTYTTNTRVECIKANATPNLLSRCNFLPLRIFRLFLFYFPPVKNDDGRKNHREFSSRFFRDSRAWPPRGFVVFHLRPSHFCQRII